MSEAQLNPRVATMDRVHGKHYVNDGNRLVLNCLPGRPATILDIGCGAGSNASACVRLGYTVDGITLSESEASAARAFCRDVFVCDLENGLPAEVQSRRYDFCLCSHVLEHLRWPQDVLRQLRPLLPQKGPRLVVALPNIMYFKSRYKLLCGKFDYEEGGIMDASHFRWFTFTTAQKLLEEAGFPVLSAQAEGNFPLSLLRRVLPTRVVRSIDEYAVGVFPGFFGYQMVFVA